MGAECADGPVLTTIEGRVGWITLNRPAAMNAITIALATALEAALRRVGDLVDVAVIQGAGGNFCAGGDFREFARLRGAGRHAVAELFVSFGRCCSLIGDLPIPVVAAVRGCAMAGGFELMLASDIVVVCEDATIADNHANYGQVPAGGSTQRLPRIVGQQRALTLLLTGGRLSPAEAVTWGIAHRVLPASTFEADVRELAEKLASKTPEAAARTKRLVRRGAAVALDAGLAMELDEVLAYLEGASARAGIDSFRTRKEST